METPDTLTVAASEILSYGLLFRLFHESADAVVVTNGETIIAVNREAETTFGYHSSQMIGQPIEILLPEALRETHKGHRSGFLHAPKHRPMGVGLILRGRHSSGREFPIEINLNAFQETEGLRVIATVRRVKDESRAGNLQHS